MTLDIHLLYLTLYWDNQYTYSAQHCNNFVSLSMQVCCHTEMVVTLLVWVCFQVFLSQHIDSKVITINANNGNESGACCIEGNCPCSSLSTALLGMTSNTVVNITSAFVTFDTNITIGLGKDCLNNITISGNGATILCSYKGSILCDSCNYVIIKGITMDKCGGVNRNTGLTLSNTTNISISNCTFQNPNDMAVALYYFCDNVVINECNFSSNQTRTFFDYAGGLEIITFCNNQSINVIINKSNFHSNPDTFPYGAFGLRIKDGIDSRPKSWNVTISQTNFSYNDVACSIDIQSSHSSAVLFTEVLFTNNTSLEFEYTLYIDMTTNNTALSILSSVFYNHDANSGLIYVELQSGTSYTEGDASFFISNSTITGNKAYGHSLIDIVCIDNTLCLLNLNNVYISSNTLLHGIFANDVAGIVSIKSSSRKTEVILSEVNMISNKCYYYKGRMVYIKSSSNDIEIILTGCIFFNNTAVHGAALYIVCQSSIGTDQANMNFVGNIEHSTFDHNVADESVVHIDLLTRFLNQMTMVNTSNFTRNIGVCIYLVQCRLTLGRDVLFMNNTADNGGALYIDESSIVTIGDGGNVAFVDNSAVLYGGAIFVELHYGCNIDHTTFSLQTNNVSVLFVNTEQSFDNTLYFSVSKYCNINIDPIANNSLMHVPYQFKYSQVVNGILAQISTNYNYTELKVSHFPVMTSPHQLKLYERHSDHVNFAHFISGQVLGNPVDFYGIVLDYFDKPAETTEFHVECLDNFTLKSNELVFDNVSPVNVVLLGNEIRSNTNVTLLLHSHINYYHQQIEEILTIELVPCYYHPAFMFDETLQRCVCYHHDVVDCYDDYNEIKRGYWFGSVNGKATTSFCPSEYCRFVNRKKTREGYFELPERINNQCEHHRSGTACSECSPGYTLAYDSPDCISVEHCSVGMTVFVVVLTCLYWIAVVCGVFSLMYFNFQLSSGYLFGIIYYYSMVNILLSNNPYISSAAFQFLNILSGFVQLAPAFLGKLCLVQGLSGIDQLFIHYSHAAAISVVLIAFVVVARNSRRVSEFISRCIIRVLCLLLLLAYTSLVSTSLLLLRPLTFTDIDKVYTYSSPNIKYFHGKHIVYGSVALICELVIGIGLPVFLMASPFLIRQCPVKFIAVKPLLDQFQGCYKDKYRWFAGYYLMCRQVLLLIVFLGNANYYHMVFYLEIACVIIAGIHACVQPYNNKFLNFFDGFILLVMVIVVMISSHDFLQVATTEIALVLVTIPLPVLCIAGAIKKALHWRRYHYVAINDEYDDDFDANDHDDLIR